MITAFAFVTVAGAMFLVCGIGCWIADSDWWHLHVVARVVK